VAIRERDALLEVGEGVGHGDLRTWTGRVLLPSPSVPARSPGT